MGVGGGLQPRSPRSRRWATTVCCWVALVPLGSVAATPIPSISVPPLFGPSMVLQRGLPFPLWGFADAGTAVSVAFPPSGREYTANASAEGLWRVELPATTLAQAPSPFNITVRAFGSGNSSRAGPPAAPFTLTDVTVGDVFICAGPTMIGGRGGGSALVGQLGRSLCTRLAV